jgi:putative aldouronate transport system substrate-binding protein
MFLKKGKLVMGSTLGLGLILVFLAGCSKKADSAVAAPAAATTPVVAAAPATAADRFKTVTHELIWYLDGWTEQADQAIVEKAANDRLTEMGYPGLTVKLMGLDWGSYTEKVNAIIFSGENYDLCYAPDWAVNYKDAVYGGAWVPWDDLINLVPEFGRLVGPYLDSVKDIGSDGVARVYRIFPMKEFASVTAALRFNKNVADKLGITNDLYNLKSIDELPKYFDMFLAAYPGRMPFIAKDANNIQHAFTQNGDLLNVYFDLEQDRYAIGIFEPWGQRFIDTMRNWRSAGYIPDYEITANTFSELSTMFGPESFLAYVNTGKPGDEEEMNPSNLQNHGFEYGETFLTRPIMGKGNILGVAFGLSVNSKNPEAAAFIYELICTDPILTNLLNFGFEDQHHTKDADGFISMAANSRYWPALQWEIGNRYLNYPLKGEPPNLGDLYDEFNKSAVVPQNNGFPWPDTYTEYNQDIFEAMRATLSAQYFVAAICGTLTDRDIQDIKDKLASVEAQRYLDILNRYYKEWQTDNR